jgi:hypothetical protein
MHVILFSQMATQATQNNRIRVYLKNFNTAVLLSLYFFYTGDYGYTRRSNAGAARSSVLISESAGLST